jgi:FkbM family methyltransferase
MRKLILLPWLLAKRLPLIGSKLVAMRKVSAERAEIRRLPENILANTFPSNSTGFVLQIGSNDGHTNDPLNTFLNQNKNWKATFVEPVPFLFQRLVERYHDQRERFNFINAAVSDTRDELNFYFIAPEARIAHPELPDWYDQLGSFDPDHIKKHFGDELNDFHRELRISCTTLNEIIEQTKYPKIDVLHIDTEGHDWKILQCLNLNLHHPKIIIVEFKHLDEPSREAMLDFLSKTYRVHRSGGDLVAIRR